jgi:cytochrome c peroxidase
MQRSVRGSAETEARMTKRGFVRVTGTSVLTVAAAIAAALPADADSGAAESRETMKVELGRRLFFDPALGRRGRVGCAECHQPEKGFSDARLRPEDEELVLPRHSQPTFDLGGEAFHWDGEFPTVRDLIDARVLPAADAKARADARFVSRVAAVSGKRGKPTSVTRQPRGGYGRSGMPITPMVEARATPVAVRLAEDHRYDEGFRLAFGDSAISSQRVGDAVEAYLASLRSSQNAADRFLAGNEDALPAASQRGLELFRGKANCSQCHSLEMKDGRAAMTDGKFHDTGVGFVSPATTTAGGGGSGGGGGGSGGGSGGDVKVRFVRVGTLGVDTGLGGVTLDEADDHSFKTPSLRDVSRTAPYMHDGSLATLEDVVSYYDRGGTPNPHLDARIKPLSLSTEEKMDLVAFLESLTGDERPGLGSVPSYRRRSLSLTVQDLEGRGMPKMQLRVVPCGDRLRGADEMPAPFPVTTTEDGTVSFAFPLSTHVRVECDSHEIGLSRPIPDWVATATLFATPMSVVSVRVKRTPGCAELPATIAAQRLPMRVGGNAGDQTPFTLKRALRLSADEALYTTSPRRDGRVVAKLTCPGEPGDLGTFEIDLAGGASETIDLGTAEDLHPELPATVRARLFR